MGREASHNPASKGPAPSSAGNRQPELPPIEGELSEEELAGVAGGRPRTNNYVIDVPSSQLGGALLSLKFVRRRLVVALHENLAILVRRFKPKRALPSVAA